MQSVQSMQFIMNSEQSMQLLQKTYHEEVHSGSVNVSDW